jgi:ABC-type Na+ efflux pump permease subunit
MDNSMRMVIIAGVLMLALLIAIVGSVSADVPIWQTAASVLGSTNQPL